MTLDHRATCSIITHPLAQHALTTLRDKETDSITFRRELKRLGSVCLHTLVPEYLSSQETTVETPLATTTGQRVTDDVVVIGILRAAVPFLEGVIEGVPQARQGLISASRDEDAGMDSDGRFPITVKYVNLPEIHDEDTVIVADPMLATGSTMVAALSEIHANADPAQTVVCAAVSAPEGIARVNEQFPAVDVVTVGYDDGLDENGFIVPGLGDAGDRAFGTTE